MRILFVSFLLAIPLFMFSQKDKIDVKPVPKKKQVATIDMYRQISIGRDTTYIDTSLTLQKEYKHNYLRKDNFGLIEYPNLGHTYNSLQYSLIKYKPLPEFGFMAKHHDYLKGDEVKYFSVATPAFEMYYKSTIGPGGICVDSFFAINPSKQLNVSFAYKAVDSEGNYTNEQTISGNFTSTVSYTSKTQRYIANAHFAYHEILNEENGGILSLDNFKNGNPIFFNRKSMDVYLVDASSFLKGNRVFIDHTFRINPKKSFSNLNLKHQFEYETKYFSYKQPTVTSKSEGVNFYRFGETYRTANIGDETNYNRVYNKATLEYTNKLLGSLAFFIDDFRTNYYYTQILILDRGTIPASLSNVINCVGGEYKFSRKNIQGDFLCSTSLTEQNIFNLTAKAKYNINNKYGLMLEYQSLNKMPNNNYQLYQSSYVSYNWANNFRNEKINSITAGAISPWLKLKVNYAILDDYLFFNDISTDEQKKNKAQIVAPTQHENTINYLSARANNEIKVWRFGLENTFLYQKVIQNEEVLNVPTFVTRNSLYYSDHYFKKALYLQYGLVFNYFTKYYANDLNPVTGEFFSQTDVKIGGFPVFDFFVNAKIQRARFYLKLEHFNSSFTGYNYFSAPTTPYRDFSFRFGFVWNFFN